MAHKSNFWQNAVLNALKGTNLTAPTSLELALYAAAPTDAAGGTEVSGSAYARQAVTLGAISGNNTVTNSALIQFPVVTGSAYTVVAWGLFDQAGNLLYWNTISSVTVDIGERAEVAIGALSIVED